MYVIERRMILSSLPLSLLLFLLMLLSSSRNIHLISLSISNCLGIGGSWGWPTAELSMTAEATTIQHGVHKLLGY